MIDGLPFYYDIIAEWDLREMDYLLHFPYLCVGEIVVHTYMVQASISRIVYKVSPTWNRIGQTNS